MILSCKILQSTSTPILCPNILITTLKMGIVKIYWGLRQCHWFLNTIECNYAHPFSTIFWKVSIKREAFGYPRGIDMTYKKLNFCR